jgi:hypothetical protein
MYNVGQLWKGEKGNVPHTAYALWTLVPEVLQIKEKETHSTLISAGFWTSALRLTLKSASPFIWLILVWDSTGSASAKKALFQPDQGKPIMLHEPG